MSTAELLLDSLDESRERLLVAIELLDDAALLEKNVINGWAITDVLTNMTAWESELVTGMMKLDQNKEPGKLLSALKDPAAYDRAHYLEMQDRDLDQIFEDLQQVRIQVEDWLSAFSERDLANPHRFSALGGRTLRSVIAQTTYQREEQFLPAIEAFSQEWLSENEVVDENLIPAKLVEPVTEEESDDQAD